MFMLLDTNSKKRFKKVFQFTIEEPSDSYQMMSRLYRLYPIGYENRLVVSTACMLGSPIMARNGCAVLLVMENVFRCSALCS